MNDAGPFRVSGMWCLPFGLKPSQAHGHEDHSDQSNNQINCDSHFYLPSNAGRRTAFLELPGQWRR